jgi:hypothetical protein
MNIRLIALALVLGAASALAHAVGGMTVQAEEKEKKAAAARAKMENETYAQCVYNQSGYVAGVLWFSGGTTKAGTTQFVPSGKPIKQETITLGEKSCTGGKGSKNVAILAVKGGNIARIAAIAATDVAAGSATVGCIVGAAALTTITAGAGAAAGAGCEAVADTAIGIIADPSIIPNAKEVFAIVRPPASLEYKGAMVVMYGTAFDPKTKVAKP